MLNSRRKTPPLFNLLPVDLLMEALEAEYARALERLEADACGADSSKLEMCLEDEVLALEAARLAAMEHAKEERFFRVEKSSVKIDTLKAAEASLRRSRAKLATATKAREALKSECFEKIERAETEARKAREQRDRFAAKCRSLETTYSRERQDWEQKLKELRDECAKRVAETERKADVRVEEVQRLARELRAAAANYRLEQDKALQTEKIKREAAEHRLRELQRQQQLEEEEGRQ